MPFMPRFLMVLTFPVLKFLTTLIISLMKSIDIRSESAVKLIAEFLDMDAPYEPGTRLTNAEHFAHGTGFKLFNRIRAHKSYSQRYTAM